MAKAYCVCYAKNKPNGETAWPPLGMAFEDAKRITIKLDALPIQSEWDGRLFLYPVKEKKRG